MPLIDAAGQAEASASLHLNGRVEATAAYSPASRLLLTAGGTASPKLGKNFFLTTRQYELGVGSYMPLGTSLLVSGIGGFGQAVTQRGYEDLSLFLGSTYSEYHARYHKIYAQVGLARVDDWRNFGFTYRITQVRFSTLTDTKLGKLPLREMLRHEALFFLRRPLSRSNNWESQVSMGVSFSGTRRLNDSQGTRPVDGVEYEVNRNLLPALYASLGLVYHPDWGGR